MRRSSRCRADQAACKASYSSTWPDNGASLRLRPAITFCLKVHVLCTNGARWVGAADSAASCVAARHVDSDSQVYHWSEILHQSLRSRRNNKNVCYEELGELQYLHHVIREAFRRHELERFKDDATMAAVDLRGADFELVPFGAGQRMCPGMPFGLLAGLLLHFDWEVPGLADPAQLDMAEEFGITARRKNDLLLCPILRVSVPGI